MKRAPGSVSSCYWLVLGYGHSPGLGYQQRDSRQTVHVDLDCLCFPRLGRTHAFVYKEERHPSMAMPGPVGLVLVKTSSSLVSRCYRRADGRMENRGSARRDAKRFETSASRRWNVRSWENAVVLSAEMVRFLDSDPECALREQSVILRVWMVM